MILKQIKIILLFYVRFYMDFLRFLRTRLI